MNNSERSDFIISPIIGRWWLKALKITEKIIRENAFELKKKKPGLSANRPSNNWAQSFCLKKKKKRVLLSPTTDAQATFRQYRINFQAVENSCGQVFRPQETQPNQAKI